MNCEINYHRLGLAKFFSCVFAGKERKQNGKERERISSEMMAQDQMDQSKRIII